MASGQNYALVWMVYLSRLIQFGGAKFDADNPKTILLTANASNVFLCGRDTKGEPFLGVPVTMMPFFTQVDWLEASICRSKGYLFLEARDPRTNMLHMAFGIKIRKARLDVFCVEGQENIESMRLNIKVFEQDRADPTSVLFADQHEVVGIPLKEIQSTVELSSDMDADYARGLLERSGVDSSFTATKLTM